MADSFFEGLKYIEQKFPKAQYERDATLERQYIIMGNLQIDYIFKWITKISENILHHLQAFSFLTPTNLATFFI